MNNSKTRDIRIDFFRGLMLVVMTMDHFPSQLYEYTYQPLGYVSSAEGFVFLSGLVAGWVYSRYSETEAFGTLWKRAFMRAAYIYSCHLLTFLLLFVLAVVFAFKTWGLENWAYQFYDHPMAALWMGVTLIYRPKYLDILPMYCFFILAVPLAVRSTKKRRLVFVVILSGLIWLGAQFGLGACLQLALARFFPADFGAFDILAWQFVFILGVIAGVCRRAEYRPWRLGNFLLIPCVALATVLFMLRHGFILKNSALTIDSLSAVTTVGPLRLLNFIVVSLIISRMLRGPVDNWFARALALLGRHSLEVFSFHVLLLYFIFGLYREAWFKEIWVLAIVGSLFLPAVYFERFKNPWKAWFSPNRKDGGLAYRDRDLGKQTASSGVTET